jgi:hypothetical protein
VRASGGSRSRREVSPDPHDPASRRAGGSRGARQSSFSGLDVGKHAGVSIRQSSRCGTGCARRMRWPLVRSAERLQQAHRGRFRQGSGDGLRRARALKRRGNEAGAPRQVLIPALSRCAESPRITRVRVFRPPGAVRSFDVTRTDEASGPPARSRIRQEGVPACLPALVSMKARRSPPRGPRLVIDLRASLPPRSNLRDSGIRQLIRHRCASASSQPSLHRNVRPVLAEVRRRLTGESRWSNTLPMGCVRRRAFRRVAVLAGGPAHEAEKSAGLQVDHRDEPEQPEVRTRPPSAASTGADSESDEFSRRARPGQSR